MRLWLVLSCVAVLVTLAVGVLQLDTDAETVLGREGGIRAALEMPAGRTLTVLVKGEDISVRSNTAAEIASALQADVAIERVIVRPEVLDRALIDWVWDHRYLLSPPSETAFQAEAMVKELREARASLTRVSETAFAARYLQDPAGSFRRSIAGLMRSADTPLVVRQGHWQSLDDKETVLFVQVADQPFDLRTQQRLGQRVLQVAGGADIVITGPRAVSARMNERIAQRSITVASIAAVLLLGWLVWMTASWRRLLLILVPLLAGGAAAVLAVQSAFGSVHVIALGFGGALMGLAMDYPIHLISHAGEQTARRRALRCIGTGAATTSAAFLALLGSGMTVLMQVGAFVATGLLASALTCWLLRGIFAEQSLHIVRRPSLLPQVARPGWLLGAVTVVSFVLIGLLPNAPTSTLVRLAPDLRADLAYVHRVLDLPSSQHVLEVKADSLAGLLDKQRQLSPVLTQAQADGVIGKSRLIADMFPSTGPIGALDPSRLPEALEQAGLAPSYAGTILAMHENALAKAADPAPLPANLLTETGLGSLLQATDSGFLGVGHLWDVRDPEGLAVRIARLGIAGVNFVDRRSGIEDWIADLADRAIWCLVAGGFAAVLLLFVLLPRKRDVALIVFATLAAGSLTAAITLVVAGGLGIFEIVSLILIVGIGVDYGLFLRSGTGENGRQLALSSVFRCAVTTLLAFGVMAFSSVMVMQSIGLTVSVGVALMVICHSLWPAEE